jgi:outer membrane protein TolC
VSDGLSLAEAEAVALWYNPDLRISRLEADRAAAVVANSGLWDDPGLDLSGGEKREDLEGGDVERSWISAASLSITIPLSGRAAAERQARSAEHQSALLAAAKEEWRTLKELRLAWLDWSASVERLKLLDEHLALLGQFAEVARSLAEAGELDPGSARMFSIEFAQKKAQRDSAALRGVGQRASLLALAGLLPDAPVTLLPSLGVPITSKAAEIDSTSIALRHPTVALLAADYEAAEARLRVELRKQYPDITLSPGFEDEQNESSITLGLGFMPIPVWNANKPGIAEAAAQRDIARARAEGKVQQVVAEVAQNQARLAGAKALRTGLVQGAAPEADLQMTEAQALLRVGEADMGMVFQALTQAYGIKQELIDVTLEEWLALVELDALTTPGFSQVPEVEVAR